MSEPASLLTTLRAAREEAAKVIIGQREAVDLALIACTGILLGIARFGRALVGVEQREELGVVDLHHGRDPWGLLRARLRSRSWGGPLRWAARRGQCQRESKQEMKNGRFAP